MVSNRAVIIYFILHMFIIFIKVYYNEDVQEEEKILQGIKKSNITLWKFVGNIIVYEVL